MSFQFTFVFLFFGVLQAAVLPVGTELNVRLTSNVSSDKPSGQPVGAVVTAPVYLNGVPVLAPGVQIRGNTADANAFKAAVAADSLPEKPATLRLQFTEAVDLSGRAHPIYCVLSSVDNARETVDASGLITGISSSDAPESQIDRGLNKLQSRFGQFAQILDVVK